MARWRASFVGVLLAGLVLPLAPPASAEDPADRRRRINSQIEHVHDDLEEASAAVRQAAAALATAARELPRAQSRLAEVEGQLAAAQAGAEAARRSLARAQSALVAGERRVAAAQAALDESRARSAQLSRAIYMIGPAGFAGSLLSSDSAADLATRAEFTRALLSDGAGRIRAAADARIVLANEVSLLEERRAAVAATERETRASLARVESLAAGARAARAAVAAQVAARRNALAVASREKAADLARYRALVAESARLAALIRRAQSRGNGRVGVGGMVWPTPGPVTSSYGYRTHPIYGYRRLHAGIDIGAPTGQGIVAVLGGTVVTAGPQGSYGNLVVVDHGNGLATAYAHQSRVLVSSGQRVSKGQRIGLVGSTGASTGPHLHFETRVNGEPVDPMRYY